MSYLQYCAEQRRFYNRALRIAAVIIGKAECTTASRVSHERCERMMFSRFSWYGSTMMAGLRLPPVCSKAALVRHAAKAAPVPIETRRDTARWMHGDRDRVPRERGDRNAYMGSMCEDAGGNCYETPAQKRFAKRHRARLSRRTERQEIMGQLPTASELREDDWLLWNSWLDGAGEWPDLQILPYRGGELVEVRWFGHAKDGHYLMGRVTLYRTQNGFSTSHEGYLNTALRAAMQRAFFGFACE